MKEMESLLKKISTTCILVTILLVSTIQVNGQTEHNETIKKSSSEDKIYKVVEQMPRFPGCEDMEASYSDKKKCADEKMVMYIYKNIKIPAEAKENGIEGTAVVSFTVCPDGILRDLYIMRDPGAGLGQAAKELVESMNNMSEKWIPGTQNGKAVKVLYTLPVKYKLP